MPTVTQITPEELLVLPDGKDYELVDGELAEKHVSGLSSYVGFEIAARLREYVIANGLGYVFAADCGFRCFAHDPTQVRKPDAAFVAADRISAAEITEGWITVVPDLVVEIVSPRDTFTAMEVKLGDYREAGVPVVWVIDPETRTAMLHRADGSSERLPQPVELVGEGPLAGFRCPLADLNPTTPQK